MKNKKSLFLFGAGGHSKVIIDMVEKQGVYQLLGLLEDDTSKQNTFIYDYPILLAAAHDIASDASFIVAIGNNQVRQAVAQKGEQAGGTVAEAVIHPSAQIGRNVTVGAGSVVMPAAVLNPDCEIAKHVIINSNATVEHDCKVAEAVHIAPGATVCGSVSIGTRTLVGAGATIHPNLTIGSDVVIGAGAVVIRDITSGVTVAGVPARVIG